MTSMLRSNKENHVSFNVPPKTPMGKQQGGMTMNKPMLAAKTPSAFQTPNRRPLGGKDANTKMLQMTSMKPLDTTMRKPDSIRRTPLSGRLQSRTTKAIEVATDASVQSDMDDEVETIPERPPPMRDVPLDHIEMDYTDLTDAITRRAVTYQYSDQPSLIDQPLDKWFQFDYSWDAAPRPKERTVSRNEPVRPKRRDFMAPTLSQQAKQRQLSQTAKLQQPIKRERLPQINVHVDSEEIERIFF